MTVSRASDLPRPGLPSTDAGCAARPFQGRSGMAASLVATVTVGLTLSVTGQAQAQSSQGLFWQCAGVSSTNPQPQYCPVSNIYPLPVGPNVNELLAVSPTQTNLSITSATGMTIATGATVALISAQGTNNTAGVCLFWRDDGTPPATNAGQTMGNNSSLWVKTSTQFQMVQATGATCAATISYYK